MTSMPDFVDSPNRPVCSGCRKGGQASMSILRRAGQAGCPLCGLVVRAISALNPDLVLYSPPRWLTSDSVDLFTLPGTPTCSLPHVEVRRTTPERDGSHYLPILSVWLDDCIKNHSECASSDSQLPRRVLDVGTSASDPIRLYLPAQEHGRYIALSHCWGKDGLTQVRTTKENIDRRIRSIAKDELPTNFFEAIQITRDLGIRYLWIDSLCIIQDDKEDWEVESSNMASTYSGAFLVIGASGARDSSEGFIASPGHRPAVQVATVENRNSKISEVYACQAGFHGDVCDPFIGVGKRGPLASRGWTLQEQVLSNRMVHFERFEMFWECRKLTSCECMELDHSYWRPPTYKAALDEEARRTTYLTWRDVVNQYHQRSLTFGSDFLPALSGIVTRLQAFGAGDYLAGLWRANLLDELLWSRATDDLQSTDIFVRAQPYRAPTWSWASLCRSNRDQHVKGALHHKPIVWPLRVMVVNRQIGHVLHAECTPSGRDPNGAVESGTITIQAKMMRVTFEKHSPDSPALATLQTSPLPEDLRGYTFQPCFDLRMEDYSTVELYALFMDAVMVAPRQYGQYDVKIHGIILRRAQQREMDDAYERVGYCVVKINELRHEGLNDSELYQVLLDKALNLFAGVAETLVTIV